MSAFEQWVIDASCSPRGGLYCFVPVRFSDTGPAEFIVGMMYLSDAQPEGGEFVGVIHEDGSDAVEAWCKEHEEFIDGLIELGGSSGSADVPDATQHKTTPKRAQRVSTTNIGGQEGNASCPPTFSDPGDGYDSAIRWHADFERGVL